MRKSRRWSTLDLANPRLDCAGCSLPRALSSVTTQLSGIASDPDRLILLMCLWQCSSTCVTVTTYSACSRQTRKQDVSSCSGSFRMNPTFVHLKVFCDLSSQSWMWQQYLQCKEKSPACLSACSQM